MISGLAAAYGHTGLKHDFPAAPYFIFGFVALLSAAGDVRMLKHGGVSEAKRIGAASVAEVGCLLRCRCVFFPGTAKDNAGEYTRIEAALCAATADTDIIDLLAVPRVVHKYLHE